MANDEHEVNGDSDEAHPIEDTTQKKSNERKHDSGAADLERVTDYVEEKEIASSNCYQGAISLSSYQKRNKTEEQLAKERELQNVSIKKEDVDLIVREMEIPRSNAERTLREHCGNVVNALIALTN